MPESTFNPDELRKLLTPLEAAAGAMVSLAGCRAFYDVQQDRNRARERILEYVRDLVEKAGEPTRPPSWYFKRMEPSGTILAIEPGGEQHVVKGGDLNSLAGRKLLEAMTAALTAGVTAVDAMPQEAEVPSNDAHETVSAMYRALSRGNNFEAQQLARYYLHMKSAHGVMVRDEAQERAAFDAWVEREYAPRPRLFLRAMDPAVAAWEAWLARAAAGVPVDVKTGWPSPELMQDDDRGLSRALADPLGESLRRKPVSIKAMPAGVGGNDA